jgi:hypothetical protein
VAADLSTRASDRTLLVRRRISVRSATMGKRPVNPPSLRRPATIGASDELGMSKKYDTVVSSGQSTLRALLTMNGGGTIAFLAFIGHIMEAGSMSVESARLFVSAMALFIYGTFSAVLAYGTIFLTNCLSRINWRRGSDCMFAITLLCGLASLVFFLIASLKAIEGFRVANELLSAKPQ